MNKKIIGVLILIVLAAIYVAWKIHQVSLDKQKAYEYEFDQRAARERTPYILCMKVAEEEYKQNFKNLDIDNINKSEIEDRLVQYQDKYDELAHNCFRQYSTGAITVQREERFMERMKKQQELYKRN